MGHRFPGYGWWFIRFHAMKNSSRLAGDPTPLLVPGHRHLPSELLKLLNSCLLDLRVDLHPERRN